MHDYSSNYFIAFRNWYKEIILISLFVVVIWETLEEFGRNYHDRYILHFCYYKEL